MPPIKGTRNNTLAGTLVISAVLATVLVVILLAGGLELLGTRPYTVSFDFETGVEGIEAGSAVNLGGRGIGTVAAVRFHPEDARTIEAIHVEIAVNNEIQFRDGAVALLEKPLLGATSAINFVSIGDGDPLGEEDPIPGKLAPPAFLTQAGYGEKQKTQVRSIIDRAEETIATFQETGRQFNEVFLPKASTIADDVGVVTADVREKWPAWSTRLDGVLENARTLSADARAFLENLDQRTEDVRNTVVSFIDENRENVRQTTENAKAITEDGKAFSERLRGELADDIKGLLADGRDALNRGGDVVDRAGAMLDEQRPNINATLANFRLTSDQLKDTLLEIRASPWRLLYRPNTRELEYELLYNSARSYARAVGELRIIADRMDALLGTPEGEMTESDRRSIAEFVEDLERTRESYEKVEDAFLDQLIDAHDRDE